MRFGLVAVIAVLGCAALPALAQAPGPAPSAGPPPLSSDGVPPPQQSETPPPPPMAAPPAIAATPPSSAPRPAPPEITALAPPGRFGFKAVDGGFLRFDSETGRVAFCSARTAGWTCETAADDRVALEQEIGRLQEVVTRLKGQLAELREPPPPRPPADLAPAPPAEKHDDAAQLRTDLERARIAFEQAWRRLVDMLVNFQQDMMRKS